MLIFGKVGTDEKIVINQVDNSGGRIQKFLTETKGGQWCLIDKLAVNEFITFYDKECYHGFNPSIDRYFKVEKFNKI